MFTISTMMSQTTASALDNRIVTFVSINDEYNCVICMQVADDPVRHSFSCRSVFCGTCMEQALNYDDCCPFLGRKEKSFLWLKLATKLRHF